MLWLVVIGVMLFVVVGIAMIAARKPLAGGQAIVFGGSVIPGLRHRRGNCDVPARGAD